MRQPGGMGVEITNGSLAAVILADTGTYALTMSGTGAITGVAGVTATGNLAVRANTSGQAVEELIATPGGNVVIDFANGTALKQVEGTITLDIAGFATLNGAFTFQKSGTGAGAKVLAAGTGIEAFMGVGTAGVRIQNGQLAFVIYPGAGTYALNAGGTALIEGVGGLTLSGNLAAAVNTTGGAVSERIG